MSDLLSTFNAYLPQHPGLLPKWLLLVAVISIGNSCSAYLTLEYTSRLYPGSSSSKTPKPSKPVSTSAKLSPLAPNSPVTPLSARTFGTWTLMAALIRLFAAYNIDNPAFYGLTLCAYTIAFLHFTSEWLIFGTTRWGAPLASPLAVSTISIVWMLWVWGDYVN